jgi:hypothetical protein
MKYEIENSFLFHKKRFLNNKKWDLEPNGRVWLPRDVARLNTCGAVLMGFHSKLRRRYLPNPAKKNGRLA